MFFSSWLRMMVTVSPLCETSTDATPAMICTATSSAATGPARAVAIAAANSAFVVRIVISSLAICETFAILAGSPPDVQSALPPAPGAARRHPLLSTISMDSRSRPPGFAGPITARSVRGNGGNSPHSLTVRLLVSSSSSSSSSTSCFSFLGSSSVCCWRRPSPTPNAGQPPSATAMDATAASIRAANDRRMVVIEELLARSWSGPHRGSSGTAPPTAPHATSGAGVSLPCAPESGKPTPASASMRKFTPDRTPWWNPVSRDIDSRARIEAP